MTNDLARTYFYPTNINDTWTMRLPSHRAIQYMNPAGGGKWEAERLAAMHDTIKPQTELAAQIIGHNVSAFDLRFLVQRSMILGVKPHPVLARAAACKPWETDRVYDTMVQWAGVGNRISLDKLCKALGIPGKGDLDGSKVWDYVQAGRIAEVADYCADDVRKVWAVYQRMTFARVEVLEDVPA